MVTIALFSRVVHFISTLKRLSGSGSAFAQRAIDQEKLLVVPGTVFGAADTHFRIAYTVSEAILDRGIAALQRLARVETMASEKNARHASDDLQ